MISAGENKKIFSVIMPIYSIGNFLNESIKSCFDLNDSRIELICVNNNNLFSEEIINNVFSVMENCNLVSGNSDFGTLINDACSKAKGDYILILNSFDLVKEDFLVHLDALLSVDKNKAFDPDVVISNFKYFNGDDSAHPTTDNSGLTRKYTFPVGSFSVKDFPEILEMNIPECSVCISSEFMKENNLVFPVSDSKDRADFDSFLLMSLLKAKSILWNENPVCYKRVSKVFDLYPDDVTIARIADSYLDTFDSLICRNNKYASFIYSHLVGMIDMNVRGNKKLISSDDYLETLRPVLDRIDFDVFASFSDTDTVFRYFDYVSPMGSIQKDKPKVLIYNWLPFDNKWHWGGGVTVYCYNIIKEMLEHDPDINIYFISSGFAYNASVEKTYIRRIGNVFGKRVHQFEIVNSPVPAEQRNIYVNPLVALENYELKSVFEDFIRRTGPYKAIHFNNIEGLSLDVLDLKREFPETNFIFSIHNYVPLCVNGSYYMRHKHCNCNPEHTGQDCFDCTRMDIRSNIALSVYKSGMYNLSPSSAISQKKWLDAFDFKRLDVDVSPDEILKFAETATFKINENCDSILAVSKRVYEIAADNGFDENKMSVSYIGTQVASKQVGHSAYKAENGLKIVFLGSDLNYEEKGYPFLLDALSKMDIKYSSKIDLVVTVRQKEHSEIYKMLGMFRSLKVINGYTHDDLGDIFNGCNLSIVPVLWEDNLPQIAIESAAYGVPVLSSSAGGASELCSSELFRFESGNDEELRNKIIAFLEQPELLDEYWKNHKGLVTMQEHMKELLGYYGLTSDENSTMEVLNRDISVLIRENDYLRKKIDIQKLNFINDLKDRLARAEAENKELKLELNTMSNINGKIIFQTVNDAESQYVGADLLKIVPDDFNFSDFYAEIKFIRLNNVAASSTDVLKITGTWFEEEGEYKLHIHQIDWDKNVGEIKDSVCFYIRRNALNIFVKHLGQFCGLKFEVLALTNRAAKDTVRCEILNQGFIFKNTNMPGDTFSSIN